MTSPFSLFACAASEVTLDRVQDLLSQTLAETLTLEYKQRQPREIAKAVAAMANSYGGIVLVGVADDRSLDGVAESEQVSVVNACHDVLEPPWQPEVIAIPLPGSDGKFLFVLRVDPERAPRPILVRGAAPIRLPGRMATADRERLRQLFIESSARSPLTSRLVRAPQLLQGADGEPLVDFILRSGLTVPISGAAEWRPISEASGSRLAEALKAPGLGTLLQIWLRYSGVGHSLTPFHRKGLNRARHLRLVSAVANRDLSPVLELVVSVDLPTPQTPIDNRLRLITDLS